MIKQEQIEEMVNWNKCVHKKICKNEFKDAPIIEFQGCEHYQPELLEGSVVLTRGEYERLKLELAIEKKRADESYTQKEVEEIIASKERIKNKETAEKILKDFKLWAREYQNKDIIIDDNGERPMTNNEKLNYLYTYLCDKYKVE